jgi:ABC-type transport system involved in multi-copper enzyme maturation permease subunit
MTGRAITLSYRSAAARARGGGFSRLLSSEWTKFRTVRGWVIGMLMAALATVLVGLLGGASGYGSCNQAACPATLGPGGEPVSDSFYFVRQPLASGGSITVRVTSLTGVIPDFGGSGRNKGGPGPGTVAGLAPWSKAGVILKASVQPGSAYAAMMVTGSHGVRMQYDYTGDIAGPPGTVSSPSLASPRWLRLTRAGDTITGYESADGTRWARVGVVHLAGLPATVQAGLFATSPQYTQFDGPSAEGGPSQDTALFDHVSLRGARPGGSWTGDNVGGLPAVGEYGFHQAGGQISITGEGDIAPDVAGGAGSGTTIAQPLLGTFAGLIAVIVVATMFVTAEYRRGLIRTTLTASPRRGQVLAAKAVVIGAVTFVPGLAAAAIAVWVGDWILRNDGVYVFSVPALTGLRVVAGTAAVLALTGVLALGLGAALRRSVVAVTVAIAVVVVPYMIALYNVLPFSAAQWLLRIAPAAGFAVQGTMPQYPQVSNLYDAVNGYYPLAPWAGLAVLGAWAALALGLAVVLLRRRDA